jgi:Ni,Fe-hydrogenase III component G
MILDGSQGLFPRIDCQRLLEIFDEYTVDQHRQTRDMIEVSVRQEHMANRFNFIKRQVADAGTSINQYIFVDKHCRRARARADATATTKYSNTHAVGVLLNIALWED